jgi:hypothetical protein
VRGLTGGCGVDYAFDAIGSKATTLQILDAIRPRRHRRDRRHGGDERPGVDLVLIVLS